MDPVHLQNRFVHKQRSDDRETFQLPSESYAQARGVLTNKGYVTKILKKSICCILVGFGFGERLGSYTVA